MCHIIGINSIVSIFSTNIIKETAIVQSLVLSQTPIPKFFNNSRSNTFGIGHFNYIIKRYKLCTSSFTLYLALFFIFLLISNTLVNN